MLRALAGADLTVLVVAGSRARHIPSGGLSATCAPTHRSTCRGSRGKDTQVGGSGIGLAVVAGLVSAHGGEVAMASELGHGTTFTIRLPRTTRGVHRVFAASSPVPSTLSPVGDNREEGPT
ncbi:MAG: ATP-binding protein [Actinomycetota bacterium]|nr:ATP-binding protein [Actinomycetota bacterium]